MKKKGVVKLSLHRETLLFLDDSAASAAAGGALTIGPARTCVSAGDNCQTATCQGSNCVICYSIFEPGGCPI